MVLFIVGFIMVLIADKYISETVEDKTIFNNMLIAVILAIVGIIAELAVAIAGRLFSFFRVFRPLYSQSMFIEPRMYPFFTTLIIALVMVWVFYIGSAIFLRKSYTTVASKHDFIFFNV